MDSILGENHPALKKLARYFDANDYLFKQGEMGQTMFIILEGTVRLLAERDGVEHVAGIVLAGEFLGEKAIVKTTPYQRYYSAQAVSAVTALELGLHEMLVLEKEAPKVMFGLLKRSFQLAAERLDRANHLIRILRSSDNYERLIHCIIYFCRTAGKKVAGGTQVSLSIDSLYHHIDMEKKEMEACLEALSEKKLLIPHKEETYLVPDESALVQFAPDLEELVTVLEDAA